MDKHQQLAKLVVSYIEERRDKKLESLYKDKPKKNKQGKITNGAFNARLSAIVKKLAPDKTEQIKVIEKAKKDKRQTALEFQQQTYQQLIALLPRPFTDLELLSLTAEVNDELTALQEEYQPINWLNDFIPKASDISFATHVAKLTHSSSKGSSILDLTIESSEYYLTTNSLIKPEIDTASANAASLPIADILKISVDGLSILDCIKSGDTRFFDYLTDDKELINIWINNLKQAYDSSQKSSYFLNKQVYFPVGDNYHLLLPLISSSLAHAIHLEHQKYYNEEATAARKQKKEGFYSNMQVRSYPNKAYLHVTGSNHSNASSLNGQRGGKLILFAALPPQWQSRYQSVASKHTLFDGQLSYRLKDEIDELRKYLLVLKQREFSISKPERNATIVSKLKQISDTFFDCITQIQLNETVVGWSMDSDLPLAQQLLLEPNREDADAKAARLAKDWIDELSHDYATWLNKQLNQSKSLNLNQIHRRLWQDHFNHELNIYLANAVLSSVLEETTP